MQVLGLGYVKERDRDVRSRRDTGIQMSRRCPGPERFAYTNGGLLFSKPKKVRGAVGSRFARRPWFKPLHEIQPDGRRNTDRLCGDRSCHLSAVFELTDLLTEALSKISPVSLARNSPPH
jgi:hypothetical protein